MFGLGVPELIIIFIMMLLTFGPVVIFGLILYYVVKSQGKNAPGNQADKSQTDIATGLERLATLKENGSISEEEFDSAKKKLLGL